MREKQGSTIPVHKQKTMRPGTYLSQFRDSFESLASEEMATGTETKENERKYKQEFASRERLEDSRRGENFEEN